MKNTEIYIIDKIQEFAFIVFGMMALYGVVFKGAWWHILTVIGCAAVAIASYEDAKKEREENESDEA